MRMPGHVFFHAGQAIQTVFGKSPWGGKAARDGVFTSKE
jgi:hypothetical protein